MPYLPFPLRALLAAPRPAGLGACPSRSRVEAFYEALEAQGEQAEAEWLWPPTVERLAQRLGAGAPDIGLLYLDVALLRQAHGASLCFEDAAAACSPLAPEDLGALLAKQNIPLLILSVSPAVSDATDDASAAGQNRQQSQYPGSASAAPQGKPLARSCVRSGVPHVVVLDERLAPEEAAQAITAFLSALLAGRMIGQAAEEAHLGAAYHAAEDAPLFAIAAGADRGVGAAVRFPSPALAPAWQRLAADPEVGGLPSEPAQGFVGRSEELVALERALRGVEGNGLVLLHGYEGLGKTTLAAHAARWLVRTGCFAQVVYTGFAGGGHRESALYDLGIRLVGEDFSLVGEENPVEAVERALVETPTLILWDNLEAVLDEGDFPLGAERLSELLQLGTHLARIGESRLCVISDNPEFPDPAYREGSLALSMRLGNMEEEDALDLLAALLAGAGADRPAPQEAREMIAALGGQPLALSLLVPLLREQPLVTVLARFEEILPGLHSGEARLGNQALDLALEASLRFVGDALRSKVLAFSVFVNGFMGPLVSTAVGMDEQSWAVISAQWTAARVLHRVPLPGFTVPFVRLHPALPRHLSRRLTMEQRSTLEGAYCAAYAGLLTWMVQDERYSLPSVRALARCELPNLRRTLLLLLASQKLDLALAYVQPLQRYLAEIGFQKEMEALLVRVQNAVTQAVPEEGLLARAGVRLMLAQGEQLMADGRIPDAGALLKQLVERMERENGLSYGGTEAAFDRGMALHRLGRCVQATGHVDLALASYAQAVDILNGLPRDEPVRRELLALYQNMGEAALAGGQARVAGDAYQRALSLASELQDRAAQGMITAQLSGIAFAANDLPSAREFAETALAHKTALNDVLGQATVWNQLGTIAWRAGEIAEAERSLREAYSLAEKAGQTLLQAQTSMQLALVIERAGRPRDAEVDYAQAIRLFQQLNAVPALVTAEMALAGLLLREGKVSNALVHAEAARAGVESLGPEARPWEVYRLLERIASAQGDGERVAHWRTRAQESYAVSPEADEVARSWQAVITGVARACLGESLSEETLQTLEKLESQQQWQHLVASIWRILEGERGADLYASLDHVDALIVRRILEAIESSLAEAEAVDGEGAAASGVQPADQEAAEPSQLRTVLSNVMMAVIAALRGNQQAQAAVSSFLGEMTREGAPEPLHRFAQALARILQGERDLAVLEGLPAEAAAPLRALLDQLTAAGPQG